MNKVQILKQIVVISTFRIDAANKETTPIENCRCFAGKVSQYIVFLKSRKYICTANMLFGAFLSFNFQQAAFQPRFGWNQLFCLASLRILFHMLHFPGMGLIPRRFDIVCKVPIRLSFASFLTILM